MAGRCGLVLSSDYCECGNEPSGCIKVGKFLNQHSLPSNNDVKSVCGAVPPRPLNASLCDSFAFFSLYECDTDQHSFVPGCSEKGRPVDNVMGTRAVAGN
jgi:hypothetical protein